MYNLSISARKAESTLVHSSGRTDIDGVILITAIVSRAAVRTAAHGAQAVPVEPLVAVDAVAE